MKFVNNLFLHIYLLRTDPHLAGAVSKKPLPEISLTSEYTPQKQQQMIGASAASMMSGASAPDLFLPARRLLASTPVTSIMHTRHAGTQWRPLILYGDNTIAEALGKLAKRELLSAPVMMAPVAPAHAEGLAGVSGTALTDHADSSVFSSFLGFVGVEDIVAALCDTAVRRMQITVPISAGPGTPEFWQAFFCF